MLSAKLGDAYQPRIVSGCKGGRNMSPSEGLLLLRELWAPRIFSMNQDRLIKMNGADCLRERAMSCKKVRGMHVGCFGRVDACPTAVSACAWTHYVSSTVSCHGGSPPARRRITCIICTYFKITLVVYREIIYNFQIWQPNRLGN